MTIAFLIVGVGLLWAALHPFTTYPLSLRWLARHRPKPVAAGSLPGRAALCVCAYKEERVIRAKIENMLAMRAALPDLELLLYVDGDVDRTADIAREYADAITLVASPARHGKTHGMNTLVARTSADYLVFSDANVEFAPGAVQALLAPLADPAVGCVCGHLVYRTGDGTTAATGSMYWRLEETIKAAESMTGSVMGADGSIFALRRAAHEPPPPDLIDDMYVSFASLCAGYRTVRAPDAIAYEESVSRPGEEFRRKIRISCQALNVHRALWPRLRRLAALDLYKYVSHKLMRWVTVFSLAASGLCFEAAIWSGLGVSLGIAALVLATAAAALIGRAETGKLATIRDISDAFIATGLGLIRSMRGHRFQTWDPPASARAAS